MTAAPCRMPTEAEAVEFLLRFRYEAAKQYRRDYLVWLRRELGDLFADQVESKARAKWGR